MDTMASDAPLPVQPNSLELPSVEEMRDRSREAYTNLFSEGMDRILADYLTVDDKVPLLTDMAQFAVFIAVVKMVEVQRVPITRQALSTAFWPLLASMKQELPGLIRQFADSQQSAE